MKKASIVLSLFFVLLAMASFTGVEDEIATALKTGNSKGLSKYFSSTIDLSVLDEEDVYSKAQAELILKSFFTKHPPKSFKKMHSGTSKLGLKYTIGTLETSKGTFRVTFYLKNTGGKDYLQQLRIDEE